MSDSSSFQTEFLSQLISIIEKNISNEHFGVSELADEMNMSRSNLLRRVKKETKLSVSQLISQVRLKHAMELLRTSSLNVSEVSHQVGFNSTSYFIKCFREYYGYPPGEVGKRTETESRSAGQSTQAEYPDAATPKSNKRFLVFSSLAFIVVVAFILVYFTFPPSFGSSSGEKSIAVLPFKNDSNDSTNLYLINGLMEATLNNLQQIEDLKVVSRTSVEKYRNTSKSIPEMAKELGVGYFVEGSGQKIGDKILLNIQLIEASSDNHLWARQYRRELKDIFELQQEIAQNIAEEIQVIITPAEKKKIEKKPTDDPVAYDYFLKGRDLFYKSTRQSLEQSIPYFKKAIEQDNKFALAYANAAMVYYYLDAFSAEKKYAMEINSCAGNAMTFDPTLAESQIAKALSYAHKKEYKEAVAYLEKALEYDPNSGLVIHFLTEFYSIYVPNTAKYLEHALTGVKLDITSHDSVTTGFKYFHLANALVQTGFVDEAITYINKSLEYDPKGTFSGYLRAWIHYAKNRDATKTKELLIQEFKKDTTRFYILQEIGKACYLMRDYKSAWEYYQKFIAIQEMIKWDIFAHGNLTIGIVLDELDQKEKSQEYFKRFKEYADNDQSIYKHLNLAMYYSYTGDIAKAIDHLKVFSKEDNIQYWILLSDVDPVFDKIKHHPYFKIIMQDIETKFWDQHQEIKVTLREKGLL